MSSEIIRLWMPDPLEETGDTAPPATRDEAQVRAASIRAGIERFAREVVPQVAQAYLCRDWVALGYTSWESYVRGEFGLNRLRLSRPDRGDAVGTLRLYGMSTRAIGQALGVDQKTVVNDLRRTGAADEESSSPAEVLGADGKRYAPTRPPADVVDAEIVEPAAPAAAAAVPEPQPQPEPVPVPVPEPAAPVAQAVEPLVAPGAELVAGSVRIAVRARQRARGGAAVYVRLLDVDRTIGDTWVAADTNDEPLELAAELNERELDELIESLVAARADLRRLCGEG